jgi:hypothetical protein
MARELTRLLEDPEAVAEMAETNAATTDVTMADIARRIVDIAGVSDRMSRTGDTPWRRNTH